MKLNKIFATVASSVALLAVMAVSAYAAPTVAITYGDYEVIPDGGTTYYDIPVTVTVDYDGYIAHTTSGRPAKSIVTGVSAYGVGISMDSADFSSYSAVDHSNITSSNPAKIGWNAPSFDTYVTEKDKDIAVFTIETTDPDVSTTLTLSDFEWSVACIESGIKNDLKSFDFVIDDVIVPTIEIPSYNESQAPAATVDSIAFNSAADATVTEGTVVDLAATVTGTGDYDDTYSVTLNGDVYADATWTAPAATEEVQTFTFVATATGNAEATATVVYTIDALPAFVNATASIEGANGLIPNSIYYTVDIDANDEEIVAPSIGITDGSKDKTITLGNVAINGTLDFYIAIGGVTSGTTYTATLNSALESIDGAHGSVTAK